MAQTERPDVSDVTIRYASTDQDIVAIHEFLLVVAKPAMRCPVHPIESLKEIIRVVNESTAIMAIKDDRLIGTIGIVSPAWWYNPAYTFMCDRWHFVLPQFRNTEVDRMMLEEADSIAEAAGMEFIDFGRVRARKRRGGRPKLLMMPRSSRGESDTVKAGGL